MLKKIFILLFIFCGITENGFTRDVVIREKGPDNGHNQIYVDPPQVTYDEELNELTVYFGSTGTLDIEYVDTGACSKFFCYNFAIVTRNNLINIKKQ